MTTPSPLCVAAHGLGHAGARNERNDHGSAWLIKSEGCVQRMRACVGCGQRMWAADGVLTRSGKGRRVVALGGSVGER